MARSPKKAVSYDDPRLVMPCVALTTVTEATVLPSTVATAAPPLTPAVGPPPQVPLRRAQPYARAIVRRGPVTSTVSRRHTPLLAALQVDFEAGPCFSSLHGPVNAANADMRAHTATYCVTGGTESQRPLLRSRPGASSDHVCEGGTGVFQSAVAVALSARDDAHWWLDEFIMSWLVQRSRVSSRRCHLHGVATLA